MDITISLLAIALLLGLLLVVRRSSTTISKKKNTTPSPKAKKTTTYHAVCIKFDDDACDAAKQLRSKRFLSDDAPLLPLADCNATVCNCRFKHYEDRRKKQDRRSAFGPGLGGNTGIHQKDQRYNRTDRRED